MLMTHSQCILYLVVGRARGHQEYKDDVFRKWQRCRVLKAFIFLFVITKIVMEERNGVKSDDSLMKNA